jgi:purine-nucleoside phosphorylase
MTRFDRFQATLKENPPQTAVILGSGLSEVAADMTPIVSLPYADIPGFVSTTVAGHKGQLQLGIWAGLPVLVCAGRVHFYEGHNWDRVTALVKFIAGWGIRRLILTNAAGGIREDLNPGDLMAIRGHKKLLDPQAWQCISEPAVAYDWLAEDLPSGVYAALTGPCYETPAEIRALQAIGADAVGMSTAMEAEAGVALGLRVAGISCITNKAAGLSAGILSHHEVEATARTAIDRLRNTLQKMFLEK